MKGFVVFVFGLLFGVNVVISQNVCDKMIGYNVTFTSTWTRAGELTCQSGYTSVFPNGTIIDYDINNIKQDNGTYRIESNQDGTECYLIQTWDSGLIECSTWSPTKDTNSMVGCYVFNSLCQTKCDPSTFETGWFACIILNKLNE